jgi:hypothetical protein
LDCAGEEAVTRTATQAPLGPSGVAAQGWRGLAAFPVYLGTTRSPFAASTDAIWPRYRERSSAVATHCQYEDVMSGDPRYAVDAAERSMRGRMRRWMDGVISNRRSTAPSHRHVRNAEAVGPG